MLHLLLFGIVIPAFAFVFATLAVHTAFLALPPLLDAPELARLNLSGRIIVELCLARSAALMTAGLLVLIPAIPKAIAIFLGSPRDSEFILELISCWFIIVLLHELGTYMLLRQRPAFVLTGLFVMMCLLCIFSFSTAIGFLAIIAAGDIARALDYAIYAVRHLNKPPQLMLYSAVIMQAERWAVLALLTHVVWTRQFDFATGIVCTVLYVQDQMPANSLYFHAPPEDGARHILSLDDSKFVAIEDRCEILEEEIAKEL